MKEKLSKEDYLLKSVLDIAPIGFWEWDIDSNRVELSNEVINLIGVDETEFDNTMEYIIDYIIAPSSKELFKSNLELALVEGKMVQCEYEINSNDDNEKWIRIDGIIVSDGKFEKIYGTMLEISEYKRSAALMKSNNAFFETLMRIIPNPIFYKNSEGEYTYCNDAFSDFLGIPTSTIIGSSVFDITPSEQASVYHQVDLDLMRSRGSQIYEGEVKYADGSNHHVIFNKSANIDSSGNVLGLVGIMNDITERKNNELLVSKQNLIKDVVISISQKISDFSNENDMYGYLLKKLVTVFEHSECGTVMDIIDDNLTVQASHNYDKETVDSYVVPLNQSYVWKHNKGIIKLPSIINMIDKMIANEEVPDFVEIKDNIAIKSNLNIPVIIDGQLRKIIFLDSAIEDIFTNMDLSIAKYLQEQIPIIHKLFALNQQTISLSRFDSLTGLMNRGYFEDTFEDRLEIAKRESIDVSVILFDLDSLKYVNDKFGHSEGDNYITAFSNLLKDTFRITDYFARLGGDEFCGIFVDSDIAKLREKLNKVRETYGKIPFGGRDSGFVGRFSYGIATYPVDGKTGVELMAIADSKMYKDKNDYMKK